MFQILWRDELFDKGASVLYFEFTQRLNIKGFQMQGKISMDLSFCQSEEGFSLDEEQRCALCFDTKEEADDYAMEMPDDDVVVVEEEII